MVIDQELIESCQYFLDLVEEERFEDDTEEDLDWEIRSLREYVDSDFHGAGRRRDESVAFGVLRRLENIWDIIEPATPEIEDVYDELMSELEYVSRRSLSMEGDNGYVDDSRED